MGTPRPSRRETLFSFRRGAERSAPSATDPRRKRPPRVFAVHSVRFASRAGAMSAAPLLARGLVCVASAEIGSQGARKPRRSATSSRPATVPDCGPPTVAEVNALAEFIARADRLLVITGAGVSTESNVPDYRSPNGAYSTGFKPMTHQEFMRSEKNQSRYWARSFAGWEEFAERTVPNAAHYALADAQKRGQVWRLITQNVDRLHHAAGSEDALELHGTTHEVICVACGDARRRRRFQLELRDANPTLVPEATNADDKHGKQTTNETERPEIFRRRPDGDVELDRDRGVGDFVVPRCRACGGGPLKPRVVFFGDAVEPETHRAATAASDGADAVLVVGSSVSTFSAFRLVRDAARRDVPVAILTKGETRADALAALKVERLAGQTLPLVLERARVFETYGY